ncbi:MAG: rhodanese-like domain-containing protein [Paludibacteraceae bacterium]|nr:rhodanese-like domain-containing protein [Paludibacteraceae bacterium]
MKTKTFKFLFFALLSAVVGVFSACSSSDDVELGDHNECTALSFKNAIDDAQEKGVNYRIVDYRKKSEYDASHIPGAVWVMEGTTKNMNDGSFAAALKNAYGTSTKLFLYGSNNSVLMMTLAGSVSKGGFGKANTNILVGGFDAWKKASYPVE